MKKRILSMALVALMLVSVLPIMPVRSTSAADQTQTLFDRYIPVNQVYSAKASSYSVDVSGKYSFSFFIGTRFRDENAESIMFAEELKRTDMQGQFFKINYKGTFGTLDKADMMKYFDIDENNYLLAMGDPSATTYENYSKWITKDSIIISIDLYDAEKNFVRNISPATAIMAVGPDGEFLTCSLIQGHRCCIYFSKQNNLFKATDDKSSSSRYIYFKPQYAWLEDKSVADGLIGSNQSESSDDSKEEEFNYEYKQYPELKGTPRYMTNNILSVNEFISPDNTYYQVGRKDGEIDPCVMNKIENVADYSENVLTVSSGVTRRTVLTADGTLYGVSSDYEMKKLASDVKQAGMGHYLTNKGEVKEINSGKTIAADCKAFAEHRYGRVIGVLKNDGSFSMGYTYLGEQKYYEKGLVYAKKDNVTTIVPGGICTKDKTFYRWVEDVRIGGYTMDPATGSFSQSYTLELKLNLVTKNAVRVFPYEYYTRQYDAYSSQTGTTEVAKTGFVENADGRMWAFGLQDTESMGTMTKNGTKSLIRRIFPIYQSTKSPGFDNGNFVGMVPEESNDVSMLINNHCSDNRPNVLKSKTDYLTDVPGGYRALDGYAYSFDNDVDDGSPIRSFKKKATSFHYLNDSSEIFKAINTTTGTGTIANLYLLPNVARSSYRMDNKSGNTILLERTDGSMWMTEIYPVASAAATVAKLGGWECSNAIQITKGTTKKTSTVDYVDLVSRNVLEKNFPAMKKGTPVETDAAKYITSKYYSQITPGKADQLSREGKTFLLLVTKTDCSYSKKMKKTIKTAIEKQKVPIYGCVNNYSSLEFVWDYTKLDSLTTPYFVLVNGDKSVKVYNNVITQKKVTTILKAAKKIGVANDKLSSASAEVQSKYPSDKISVDSYEWGVLKYINQKRFANRLSLLTMPDALQNACNIREKEIVLSYDHTRPNGEKPYTTISDSFEHKYAAENIASGQHSSTQVVTDWMNSEGHRANILNDKFGYMGVGYMNTNPPYWVQMFTDCAGYKSVTTSTGSMKFKSLAAMQKEYLICVDNNNVESYMPLDTSVMSKKGNKYTLKLYGKNVTLTVSK